MFLDVKIGELYLGYNYEEGGAAAELPTVMGTFIASVAITPCPKNPPHNFAVQFGQQFLHFCKNDFNHRLMCDGCADSS